MKYNYRHDLRKIKTNIINSVSTVVLVFSSVAGGLPLFMSQKAFAVDNTVCSSACNATTVQAAIDSATAGDTISFGGNATLDHQLTITKSLIVNGNGFTITPNFTYGDGANNAAIGIIGTSNVTINNLVVDGTAGIGLHGINVYASTNVNLNGITVNNNKRNGLVVNSSTVTVSNIHTSNNGWGGIDVDQKATPISSLTINRTSTHSEAGADIYVDDTTKAVAVNDNNSQYGSRASGISGRSHDLVYKLYASTPPATVLQNTKVVLPADMSSGGWFFYNDSSDKVFTSSSVGNYQFETDPVIASQGALKFSDPTNKMDIGTYKYAGTALKDIAKIGYSSYNTADTNAKTYIQFNVNFDGNDSWQNRLTYIPANSNGTWQQNEGVQNGAGMWQWSRMSTGNVSAWPDGVTSLNRSWNDIINSFPNAKLLPTGGGLFVRSEAGSTNYIDNIYLATATNNIKYNFENITPDTIAPTISDLTVTNNALWGANYDISSKPNHLSEITGLPVVGGTVQIGASFNDDRLLTNVISYLPNLGFFTASDFTPVPASLNSWTGITPGRYTVNWDTLNGADWRKVPDGNYSFDFNARDGGNGQNGVQNNSYSTTRLTVDNTGPAVSFASTSPSENKLVSGTINVDGIFTDANGLMNTDIGVHDDGRTGEGWKCHTDWPGQGTKNCQIDTTQLTDGTYKLTMAGRDKAGNVTQVFRTISVDNSAPIVALTAPTGTVGGDKADIMGYVNDANFRYYNCYITTNQVITFLGQQFTTGQEPKNSGSSLADPRCITTWESSVTPTGTTPNNTSVKLGSFTITDLPSGSYTIHVQGHDLAGNVSEDSTTFTLDHTAPIVTDKFDVSMLTGDKVTLTPVVTGDTNVTYSWQVQDSKLQLLNDPHALLSTPTLTIGPAPKGTYSVTLTATDQAGNATLVTYNVTISTPSNPTSNTVGDTTSTPPKDKIEVTTNAGNARSPAATSATPAVLGATDIKNDATGQVKGASTTNKEVAIVTAKKSDALLGLGWWWLAVLAALIGAFLFVLRRSDSDKKA